MQAWADGVEAMVGTISEGDVMVIENTRFHEGEPDDDPVLAKSFLSLADLLKASVRAGTSEDEEPYPSMVEPLAKTDESCETPRGHMRNDDADFAPFGR